MHIPDGYLGPQTYLPLWGVILAAWSWASRKLSQALDASRAPFFQKQPMRGSHFFALKR